MALLGLHLFLTLLQLRCVAQMLRAEFSCSSPYTQIGPQISYMCTRTSHVRQAHSGGGSKVKTVGVPVTPLVVFPL